MTTTGKAGASFCKAVHSRTDQALPEPAVAVVSNERPVGLLTLAASAGLVAIVVQGLVQALLETTVSARIRVDLYIVTE